MVRSRYVQVHVSKTKETLYKLLDPKKIKKCFKMPIVVNLITVLTILFLDFCVYIDVSQSKLLFADFFLICNTWVFI
jgi:hypothetical protein